jgi:hypothetical protein
MGEDVTIYAVAIGPGVISPARVIAHAYLRVCLSQAIGPHHVALGVGRGGFGGGGFFVAVGGRGVFVAVGVGVGLSVGVGVWVGRGVGVQVEVGGGVLVSVGMGVNVQVGANTDVGSAATAVGGAGLNGLKNTWGLI